MRDQVATFIASDRFERLLVGAVETVHRAAVRLLRDESELIQTDDGTITLNLVPAINAVLERITERVAGDPRTGGRPPRHHGGVDPRRGDLRLENALGSRSRR